MAKRHRKVCGLEFAKDDDGKDALFFVWGGLRIARRGNPRTPHARQWISLEPGYVVRDIGYPPRLIEVEFRAARRRVQ
jgi:hypothetical protein